MHHVTMGSTSGEQDIIEVEVFNKLFASIAEEMGIILAKSAFSSNIKERRDFSCAIFDRRGELVAQAAHIPVHLGSLPKTIEHVLQEISLQTGDIIITNDPFKGGSHLPDITLIEGVFDNSKQPQFYVVNRAHHADIGGNAPGSMGITTTLADEGVLIPPTLLYKKKKANVLFLENFLNKVRNAEERKGDLQAQTASLRRGKIRLRELVSRYGADHLFSVADKLKKYSQRLMQNTISQIPDGHYVFTDHLDDDGINREAIALSAGITITDGKATVDFSKSADQRSTPLNSAESVVISATIYVFQCLMGEGYPLNHGTYQPIHVITRRGSILNPVPPAPVAAGNVETSQRVVDVLFGALAKAVPHIIPAASCGSMNNIAIRGGTTDRDCRYTYYETIGGGMGARPGQNGLSGIHTHMTNTMNTPVEALEHTYPFQIERYTLRRRSGGDGQYTGGEGIIRAYRFTNTAEVSLLTERRRTAPYGLGGGKKGGKGENILVRGRTSKKLKGKINLKVSAGDLLVIKTPGGGGLGGQ